MHGNKYILQILGYQSCLTLIQKFEKRNYYYSYCFLQDEIASLKEDHNEFALESLLDFGESFSHPIPIYAPAAHHHARWMAKIIYTIK